jgi:hypothetical protein
MQVQRSLVPGLWIPEPENFRKRRNLLLESWSIVVTYFQFDSNICVLYVFLGFFKNTWKYLIQRPIFKPLYNYNVFLKILENTSFLAPSKNTRISYVTTMSWSKKTRCMLGCWIPLFFLSPSANFCEIQPHRQLLTSLIGIFFCIMWYIQIWAKIFTAKWGAV